MVEPMVDGITEQNTVKPTESKPQVQSSPVTAIQHTPLNVHGRLPFIILAAIGGVYALFGFVLLVIFPTPDGSLGGLKSIGTMVFTIGILLWISLAAIASLRIATFKDKPRLQKLATLRCVLFEAPMIILSGMVLLLVNREPKLSLTVLSPEPGTQLLAPLNATFAVGEKTLQYFKTQGLQPIKYQWDRNGDGVLDQETFEPRVTFSFQKQGVYSVVAKVIMNGAGARTVSKSFFIPKASFSVDPIDPIIDEPATLSLSNVLPVGPDPKKPWTLTKAKWDFDGDGSIDLEGEKTTVVYTYRRTGKISTIVTAMMSNGTELVFNRQIEVVEPTAQPFPVKIETEPGTLLGTVPFGVIFTVRTDEPLSNVSWNFGDQKTGDGIRVAHVYNAVGNFTATAVIMSQTGTVAKLSKVVRITNPLSLKKLAFEGTPNVKGDAITGEVPLVLNLTPTTSSPLISFSWDAPGATEVTTNESTLNAVYRSEGKYYVDLIAVDPEDNVLRKRIDIIVAPPSSIASFVVSTETPVVGDIVKFDASDTFLGPGEIPTGFEWDFGDDRKQEDGAKLTGSHIEHSYNKSGNYRVTLRVITTQGKSYTATKTLSVRDTLVAVRACFIASKERGVAVPTSVQFSSSKCSMGAVKWKWDFGDGSFSEEQDPIHTFTTTGDFNVTLTVEDAKKKKDTYVLPFTVSP